MKDESWTSINVTIDYGIVTMDYGKLQSFVDWNLKYEPWNLSESWNMGPHLSVFEIS